MKGEALSVGEQGDVHGEQRPSQAGQSVQAKVKLALSHYMTSRRIVSLSTVVVESIPNHRTWM